MSDELREIIANTDLGLQTPCRQCRYFVDNIFARCKSCDRVGLCDRSIDYLMPKLQPYIDKQKKVSYKTGFEVGRKLERGIQAEDRDYKAMSDGT